MVTFLVKETRYSRYSVPLHVHNTHTRVDVPMKRPTEEESFHDPVLAYLDSLINGPPPAKAPRVEAPPLPPVSSPPPLMLPLPPLAQDPVLAQLDALINGGGIGSIGSYGTSASTSTNPDPEPDHNPYDALRGPPGLLREFGGVRGWMASHEANANDAATMSSS